LTELIMKQMVLGAFKDRQDAENAIDSLKGMGLDPKDISIMVKDAQEGKDMAASTGAHVMEGAASGAATGAAVGAVAGLLIGIGAIAIPGIGGLLVGGPLAAALGLSGTAATTASGAMTGALAGGLVGALVGLGVPEDDAKAYEQRINEGGVVLAVPVSEGSHDVAGVLQDNHADQISKLNLNS
jgi:hypothetical protein